MHFKNMFKQLKLNISFNHKQDCVETQMVIVPTISLVEMELNTLIVPHLLRSSPVGEWTQVLPCMLVTVQQLQTLVSRWCPQECSVIVLRLMFCVLMWLTLSLVKLQGLEPQVNSSLTIWYSSGMRFFR